MWSAEIDPVINSAAHFDFGNVGKDLIHWSNGYWQSDNQINYCFFKNPVDATANVICMYLLRINRQPVPILLSVRWI